MELVSFAHVYTTCSTVINGLMSCIAKVMRSTGVEVCVGEGFLLVAYSVAPLELHWVSMFGEQFVYSPCQVQGNLLRHTIRN